MQQPVCLCQLMLIKSLFVGPARGRNIGNYSWMVARACSWRSKASCSRRFAAAFSRLCASISACLALRCSSASASLFCLCSMLRTCNRSLGLRSCRDAHDFPMTLFYMYPVRIRHFP